MTEQEACKRAVELAGGAAELARKLNALKDRPKISRHAIYQWARVPDRRVIDVEHVINKQVTRHELRPDLYPTEAA